jgi:hypothetical protein
MTTVRAKTDQLGHEGDETLWASPDMFKPRMLLQRKGTPPGSRGAGVRAQRKVPLPPRLQVRRLKQLPAAPPPCSATHHTHGTGSRSAHDHTIGRACGNQ